MKFSALLDVLKSENQFQVQTDEKLIFSKSTLSWQIFNFKAKHVHFFTCNTQLTNSQRQFIKPDLWSNFLHSISLLFVDNYFHFWLANSHNQVQKIKNKLLKINKRRTILVTLVSFLVNKNTDFFSFCASESISIFLRAKMKWYSPYTHTHLLSLSKNTHTDISQCLQKFQDQDLLLKYLS